MHKSKVAPPFSVCFVNDQRFLCAPLGGKLQPTEIYFLCHPLGAYSFGTEQTHLSLCQALILVIGAD